MLTLHGGGTGLRAHWRLIRGVELCVGRCRRAHMRAAGLVVSRFGLWMFDLAANQLLQEHTEPSQLGTYAHLCCMRVYLQVVSQLL